MIINPPALTIVNHHTCTSCGASLPTPGRWAWVIGNGKRGELCLECAALSPDERQQRTPATAAPEKWTEANYRDYLKSAHWRQFKAEAYKHYKRKCYLCNAQGKDAQIDLHHSTYERLGGELISDVIPLCHDCHSKFHFEL